MTDIFTVNLPDIGEGVVEGEVVEWLKKVGDPLKQDEPVVVVMTDKATVELPAPYPGVLAKQYYQPGEISIRDRPLYDIQLADKMAVPASASKPSAPNPTKAATKQTRTEKTDYSCKENATLATPKVRHLARELGIEISTVSGSGKQGRILIQDLTDTPSKTPSPECTLKFPESKEIPLLGVRGMMAKKMAEAAEIPMFTYFEQAEATRLVQIRQSVKKEAVEAGIHLSYMPFFIRALSLCAKQFPLLLSSLDMKTRKLFVHPKHHIGIAIASEQGLIVPVLKDVQDMKLEGVIRAYEELKNKALANQLEPNDMRGAVITISNFGALEGDGLWATPIINAPEVAILAVGHMRPQAVVRHGEVVVREMIAFSWSFDHRVLDGAQATRISNYFCSLIRDPASLL
jgi:pyruvate/2-oxoglutarate dehydrogenase complex dihydrolipoamide acyltransferase (E2) component